MDVIYVIYIMKYYENMNGSEKYQVKGNSSCRRECEEEKNGIKEELFIISIIFFLLKILKLKDRKQNFELDKA